MGADLQRDEDQKKKAYTLLGLFISQLSVPKNGDEAENLENLGKQFLFERQSDDEGKILEDITNNLVTG